MHNIINKEHEKISDIYSENLREIIDILLNKNPEKRITICDLLKLNDEIKEKYKIYLENRILKFEDSKNERKSLKLTRQISICKDELILKKHCTSYIKNNENPFEYEGKKSSFAETPFKKFSEKINTANLNTPSNNTQINSNDSNLSTFANSSIINDSCSISPSYFNTGTSI